MQTEDSIRPEPLSDTELDRLAAILARFANDGAMNLEELDGFLAALACGPDIALPSEYLSEICGRDLLIEGANMDQLELQDFVFLILRHWNVIADTLHSGDVYLPLLTLDETGLSHANDWAQGFVRGMRAHAADWSLLLDDEEHGGPLIPIFALAHENDPDPTLRPYQKPITAEKREELIAGAAAGVMRPINISRRHGCSVLRPIGTRPPFGGRRQRLAATIHARVDQARSSSTAVVKVL